MEKVEVQSTSNQSAVCSDIPLRVGEQVRLVFRPEVVENPHDPAACIKGRFLYQKKGKRDAWEDFETIPLSSVKKGEGYQLELKSGELLPLLRTLSALYKHFRAEGVPSGTVSLVEASPALVNLLMLGTEELNAFLADNSNDALKILRRVLQWLSADPSAIAQFAEDRSELPELNALVGLANLQSILKLWKDNEANDDEEFWQRTLSEHSFVLSQLFAYPVVIIRGKAYVGGKRIDNTKGQLVDFLGRVPTSGAAVLIEIKTPGTPLLAAQYRQQVYPPSTDVTGAISQVLQYRETFLSEMHALTAGEDTDLTLCDPRCVVIAGCASTELKAEPQKRSFERFRERLTGVTLITFDEIFARVSAMIELIRSTDASRRRSTHGARL